MASKKKLATKSVTKPAKAKVRKTKVKKRGKELLSQQEELARRVARSRSAIANSVPSSCEVSIVEITADRDDNVFLSSRNLSHVLVLETREVDPVSLVRFNNVVLTRGAVAQFEEMLG